MKTVLLIVLLILIVTATSCQPTDYLAGAREVTNENGLNYTVLIIEGMTCIYFEYGAGYEGYAGLTCNWNEWRP